MTSRFFSGFGHFPKEDERQLMNSHTPSDYHIQTCEEWVSIERSHRSSSPRLRWPSVCRCRRSRWHSRPISADTRCRGARRTWSRMGCPYTASDTEERAEELRYPECITGHKGQEEGQKWDKKADIILHYYFLQKQQNFSSIFIILYINKCCIFFKVCAYCPFAYCSDRHDHKCDPKVNKSRGLHVSPQSLSAWKRTKILVTS